MHSYLLLQFLNIFLFLAPALSVSFYLASEIPFYSLHTVPCHSHAGLFPIKWDARLSPTRWLETHVSNCSHAMQLWDARLTRGLLCQTVASACVSCRVKVGLPLHLLVLSVSFSHSAPINSNSTLFIFIQIIFFPLPTINPHSYFPSHFPTPTYYNLSLLTLTPL